MAPLQEPRWLCSEYRPSRGGMHPGTGYRWVGSGPILIGSKDAARGALLTLDVERCVYDVLECLRACEVASLGDVADQEHWDAEELLTHGHQRFRTLAHLHSREARTVDTGESCAGPAYRTWPRRERCGCFSCRHQPEASNGSPKLGLGERGTAPGTHCHWSQTHLRG